MEQPNVTRIPIVKRQPANDPHPGALRFLIPDDCAKTIDARTRAGLIPDHTRLPDPREAINVVIAANCGQHPALIGTIKAATCVVAIDAARILVNFRYGESDPGTKSAWVELTQITFPKRNADCEVV